jgi:hypothetical protein
MNAEVRQYGKSSEEPIVEWNRLPRKPSKHNPKPFTITSFRPKVFQALGKPNPTTGVIKYVPMNRFRVLTRKGVLPLAGQSPVPAMIDSIMLIPAGSDSADAPNIRAMASLHIGALTQQPAGIGDTLVSGIM